MLGIKHLVNCHCYLKIYQKNENIIYHKFPVYSKIDENGNIIPKNVKCNNCNAFHKVYEIQKSEIFAGKDDSNIIYNIEDFKFSLPSSLYNILKEYKNDISNFEYALDILKEKEWGSKIILKREIIDEMYQIKYLLIKDKEDYEIITETINDTIIFK